MPFVPHCFNSSSVLSCVFKDLSIHELDVTVGGQEGDQARNAVDDQPRIALALAECFIRESELACLFRDPFFQFLGESQAAHPASC